MLYAKAQQSIAQQFHRFSSNAGRIFRADANSLRLFRTDRKKDLRPKAKNLLLSSRECAACFLRYRFVRRG
jgi:hypothetical protein